MNLNRREILTASAGLALAGPLSAAHAVSTRSSPIRKCLKYGMVRVRGSILEKFQLLKELGFEGVELDGPCDLDEAQVIAARDKSGLAIPGLINGVAWRTSFSDPRAAVRAKAVENLRTALRQAKKFGATSVLVIPGVVNKEVSYDAAYERSQTEIKKAVPLAEELGVKICFENVWNNFLVSPLESARYVDEFSSPMVAFYFDVGNVLRYGWPEQWIRILGKRIFKLDIKEFSIEKMNKEGLHQGFNVKLGEGDCDWPSVMAALRDIGYSGWGSAEVGGGGKARLKEISERMDRILV